MNLNASLFFTQFCEEVTAEGCYRPYHGREGFTHAVINPAIKKILRACDCTYAPEYYTVDHTAWITDMTEEEKKAARTVRGLNPHAWTLTALVEHENDARDFHYEVLKLAPFRCPLRVVIGYNARRARFGASPRSDAAKLAYIADLLKTPSFYPPDPDAGEEFLVILGDDAPGEARYRGYLYHDGGFVPAFGFTD